MNGKQPWPGPLWAVQRDKRPPSSGLSRREHRQMRSAMMLGRPLPPRLARAAVQYAPTLQSQAWLGYLLLMMGALFVAMGTVQIFTHGFPWWESACYAVAGVGWLTTGVWWFWAARRAGRAARTGQWPETGAPGAGRATRGH